MLISRFSLVAILIVTSFVNYGCDLANGTVKDCLFRTVATSPYNGESFWAPQNGTVQIICYGNFGCTPDEYNGHIRNYTTGEGMQTKWNVGEGRALNKPTLYMDAMHFPWGTYAHNYWARLGELTSGDQSVFEVGPAIKPLFDSTSVR